MVPAASRRSLRATNRSTRSKPTISYADPSSDDSNFDDDSETEIIAHQRPTRQNTRSREQSSKRRRPSPQSFDSDTSADELQRQPTKKRKASKNSSPRAPKAQKVVAHSSTHQVIYDGVIPDWQSLPYQILLQIFEYASHPIYDEHTFQPSPSGKWLLQMACVCKAFTEPSLTALYTSPPLVPMIQAHRLVDLLMEDPTRLAFGYRQKIQSLQIDIGQVAAYSLPGSGHLGLFDLIKYLPRLTDLELYHQKDMSPYRTLDEHIKWTYPEKMFEALEYIDPAADASKGDKTSVCKLKSWRWSSRLAGKKFSVEKIKEIHLKPSFLALRKVAFVNYQVPTLAADEEDPKHENILADSLKVLKNLDHLIFESSTLVNPKLLPLLPRSLRHLELINCWEVVADGFAEFLLTHGSQLRTLTLNHNQSLSLTFLPILGEACPKLQVFKMNLVYYNLHATYRDSEPQYDQLLLAEQVPVWPSTLQTIDLTNLRKWETEAAEMFFQSLIDSAATLPELRRLKIQAILNIGWRDRASFRDKWIGSLERVFKRVSAPPKTHTSIRPMEELKPIAKVEVPIRSIDIKSPANRTAVVLSEKKPETTESISSSRTRRSQRSCANKSKQGIYVESSSSETEAGDPDTEATFAPPAPRESKGRTCLIRELKILEQTAGIDSPSPLLTPTTSFNSNSSDDDHPLLQDLNRDKKGKGKEFIHGMCDVVELRIDNLRPTEHQFTERDILGSEESGDEDWDEGNDGVDDGKYAW
ncbi:hypothetical protein G7Y89_g9493 [Cudoniella acicularis]|uniref:F-box domain-containing protein n=1 Tax=Cudoniella acicularis TaxID=354080 RepID=A0A8H4VZK9_9HELO|nr:hypothetical protein G7Y89_g9493 [Cudoniella acicularis]